MIVILIAALWILSLSLVAGLCVTARRGDKEFGSPRGFSTADSDEVSVWEPAGEQGSGSRVGRIAHADGVAA